jgi:hypothetical protein
MGINEEEYNYEEIVTIFVSETWVTTKRDMTRLEAAEIRFLVVSKDTQD